MTEQQFLAKTDELIENSVQSMKDCARKLLLTGAFDLDDYKDDYELPKAALFAIFHEMAYQQTPFTKNGLKTALNLRHFT